MSNKIGIITSDPDSLNYQIIEKSLFFFKKKLKNKYFFIGSEKLFKKKIKKKNNLKLIDVPWENNNSEYILKSFEKAFDLIKKNKIDILINLPLNKKKIFKNKYPGVTEFVADKFNCLGKETMLLFNENFSVSPVTTHVKIKHLNKKITKKKILNNINNVSNFYKKILNSNKPKIGVLGLNPHNGIDFNTNEESKIIKPLIKKNRFYKIFGPISPDSSFLIREKYKIDCLIGHYHDQVLTTFKYIHKFSAINITLGLPFIRISPDHGTGKDLKNKKKIKPDSFLYALQFCEKYYKKL